jgi:hypothetical protein
LGKHLLLEYLKELYVRNLRSTFGERLDGNVDLVLYWLCKAWEIVERNDALRAGLVATNSVRGGLNGETLRRIVAGGRVFDAWSDEPWIIDGAAVRVSLICFDNNDEGPVRLDGKPVPEIASDLTARAEQAMASQLSANRGLAFIGRQKDGPIDIPGDMAREMLLEPQNPNGRTNANVVKPWLNGADIVRRPSGRWLIDFNDMDFQTASLYVAPFEYCRKVLKPIREKNRDRQRRENWWRPGRTGNDLRNALSQVQRFIITARVSKYRLFVWAHNAILPDSATAAIARDDDTTFGILHSRFHEQWSLRMCTWLGVGNDPRYTPTTCFETFPFPESLTPNIPADDYADDPRAKAIAAAAARLNELRGAWLNPRDLVQHVPEVVPGYPDRILPVDDGAAAILKKRTLTNLYNERPAWLDHAHRDLDAAVAAAYGWPADLPDDAILERLFKLNQERAAGQ